MSNSYKNQVTEIREEQLIDSILNRKKMEIESIIQAAKQNPKASKEEIVSKGKAIFEEKQEEKNKANIKELERLIRNLKNEENETKEDFVINQNLEINEETIIDDEQEKEENLQDDKSKNVGIISRMLKGIQKYTDNMDFYDLNKTDIIPKNKKEEKNSFLSTLKIGVDTEQAIKNAKKKVQRNNDEIIK